jgi:hypothetical protein
LLCVAVFEVDALTSLPLFWVVVPLPPQGLQELPLAIATFGPLSTTGADVAFWLAEFDPSFDCVPVCVTLGADGGGSRSAHAGATPPTSPSTRLATSAMNKRFIVYVSFEFGLPRNAHADPWACAEAPN